MRASFNVFKKILKYRQLSARKFTTSAFNHQQPKSDTQAESANEQSLDLLMTFLGTGATPRQLPSIVFTLSGTQWLFDCADGHLIWLF